VLQLVIGDKTAAMAAAFLDHLRKRLQALGISLEGVLTDNGPEFTGKDFTNRITELGLTHLRIPPRSPNHNAVCERFHGTVLQELFRPHFHRGVVTNVALLDRDLQAWIEDYNTHRPNHGDYMRGRTPLQVKRALLKRLRHTAAQQPAETSKDTPTVTPTRNQQALGAGIRSGGWLTTR